MRYKLLTLAVALPTWVGIFSCLLIASPSAQEKAPGLAIDFDEASRDPAKSLFTDFTYHALGAPRCTRIPKNADLTFNDLGLCDRAPMSGPKLSVKDTAQCEEIDDIVVFLRTLSDGYKP